MAQLRDISSAGTIKEQISAAIGVHGMWKQRILGAAHTGKSEWAPDFVKSSHNCDFGKWLDSFPDAAKNSHYKKVFELHASFHEEASRVLAMAINGKRDEAEAAIALGTKYGDLTVNLTRAMMDWKENV